MEKTFIEKLKQIERLKLYDLLNDVSIWKSMNINNVKPNIERMWCQLGNYRIYLHFIHKCEREETSFYQNHFSSAVHVIDGEYKLGISSEEHSETFSKIITQGSMYYEVPKEKWIYIRPVDEVCSNVMITEEPPEEDKGEYEYLHNDRVIMMLEYFKGKYFHTIKTDEILNELKRGDWVVLDEKKMNKNDYIEYRDLVGKKGFVIKNSSNDGLSIRFENDRHDEFNHKILTKLEKEE